MPRLEEHLGLREEVLRDCEAGPSSPAAVAQLMDRVREADERLLVATRHAQTMTEAADLANRLKDEFLAVVSHELRTPLNAVLGWTRMLRAKQLRAERADHAIATIERHAAALAHIIDDLLDVSRLVAGTLRAERRPVDLAAIASAAVEIVRPSAAAKDLQVHIAAGESPLAAVMGDASRLQQVVANLLSNAVKFTPAGGRIEVTVQRLGAQMEIRVSDTGEGMSAEFLPYAFDRFRQADGRITRRHGGLGLGLAIVGRLVDLHGGSVRAESAGADQGATFIVRLPVSPIDRIESAATAPHRAMAVPSFTDALHRLDRVHVMLVEDDLDGSELISVVLKEAGATVTAAMTVHDALAHLQRVRPDILVSDIGLPDDDGYALIQRVRERETISAAFLPAIALTGYARAEDRDRALAAGFQVHVVKPVDPAALTKIIAGLVVTPPS